MNPLKPTHLTKGGTLCTLGHDSQYSFISSTKKLPLDSIGKSQNYTNNCQPIESIDIHKLIHERNQRVCQLLIDLSLKKSRKASGRKKRPSIDELIATIEPSKLMAMLAHHGYKVE